jgi:hypothetical protein
VEKLCGIKMDESEQVTHFFCKVMKMIMLEAQVFVEQKWFDFVVDVIGGNGRLPAVKLTSVVHICCSWEDVMKIMNLVILVQFCQYYEIYTSE